VASRPRPNSRPEWEVRPPRGRRGNSRGDRPRAAPARSRRRPGRDLEQGGRVVRRRTGTHNPPDRVRHRSLGRPGATRGRSSPSSRPAGSCGHPRSPAGWRGARARMNRGLVSSGQVVRGGAVPRWARPGASPPHPCPPRSGTEANPHPIIPAHPGRPFRVPGRRPEAGQQVLTDTAACPAGAQRTRAGPPRYRGRSPRGRTPRHGPLHFSFSGENSVRPRDRGGGPHATRHRRPVGTLPGRTRARPAGPPGRDDPRLPARVGSRPDPAPGGAGVRRSPGTQVRWASPL
jgi:hypothetical protein